MNHNQYGEKNSNWKGGVSRSTKWRRINRAIEKHGINPFTCQVCGFKSLTCKRLNIHHKNLNDFDDSKENLEVLCASCHSAEHNFRRLRDENGKWTT